MPYMTEEMWQFIRKPPGPYMTEEMWRIVRDVTDPFVLAKAVRETLDSGIDPFYRDTLFYTVVEPEEWGRLGLCFDASRRLGHGFQRLLDGMQWLQDRSRDLQRAGKGAISLFQFPLFGGNNAKITPIEEIPADKFKNYERKRRTFWCYEPLGRELLKQEKYFGKIESLHDRNFVSDTLLALAMGGDQEVHDAVVYVIKKEFDPMNDGEVLSAVHDFMVAIGLNVVEYEGFPELIPAISVAEYEEYIKNGGVSNENVKRYITGRERREATAEFRYVPSPKRLYRVLKTDCYNQHVLKNNPEDVKL